MVSPFPDPFSVRFSPSDLLSTTTATNPTYLTCLPPTTSSTTTTTTALYPLPHSLFPPEPSPPPPPVPAPALAPDTGQHVPLDLYLSDLQAPDVLATAAQWDEIQDLQRELRRTMKERDEARMAVSTLRNEVYAARQTEKRLRNERDEARGQVAFLKRERAAGRATEQRLRRERDAARAVAIRRSGRELGGGGLSPEEFGGKEL